MSLFYLDSSCELKNSLIKKLGVECIEYPYLLDDKKCEYTHNFDFTKYFSKVKKDLNTDFYKLTKKEYVKIFDEALKQNDDIIYIHPSSQIVDNTNLNQAIEELSAIYSNKIVAIDSENFSIGQGLISYYLARQYRKGLTIDELQELSYTIKNEFASYFILDNIDNLKNLGLIDDGVIGTALNIKQIVTINDYGKFSFVDKTAGRKKAIAKLIDILRKYGEDVADYQIGIVYSNNEKDAIELRDRIVELYGEDTEILFEMVSPNNMSILGLGVLGLSFHVHKKIH